MNEREPRAERVQLLVLNRLAFFLGQAAKHSRTINALVRRAKLSDSQVEELFHAEASHPFYIVCASALLNLWKETDDWLRRLRRCAYPKCDTPTSSTGQLHVDRDSVGQSIGNTTVGGD